MSFNTVKSCMLSDDNKVKDIFKNLGIEHITYHSKEGKLRLCKEISSHQQQIFLKNGINETLTECLKKQKEHCGICK